MKSVLIVEDDADIRESLASVMEIEGYPVQTAENGQAALDLLSNAEDLPGLIFLDLMMPVMDGVRFLFAKKDIPRLAPIPVVVLTAGTQKDGWPSVVEHIKKPVELGDLLKVAEKYAGHA